MKQLLTLMTLLSAAATFAEPSVQVDGVKMRYPFSRLTDIDYTVTDPNGEAGGYALEVSVTAMTTDGEKTWTASHFETYAVCDLPTAEGSHRITWDPSSEADFFASAVKVKLTLKPTGLTKATAGYLIVDVSGGTSATSYPVTYAPASVASAEFNKRLYKTTKIVLKKCSAGTFQMGGTSTTGMSAAPVHYVQLTEPFWLGLFQVTDKQYTSVVTGKSPSDYNRAAQQGQPDTDVESVNGNVFQRTNTVYAANGFLANLTAKAVMPDGAAFAFVLPTEAQWEYAARAGGAITQKYAWGGDSSADAGLYAWTDANCKTSLYPHEVGTREPTGWGFYDLHGNVWELCRDFLEAYPTDTTAENPQRNPVGTGTTPCIRGCGSFWRPIFPLDCRYASATNTGPDFGFRLAAE